MRVSAHTGPDNRAVGANAGGLRYLDSSSGCHVRVCSPGEDPALWNQYLEGALNGYRHYGVQGAIDVKLLADGRSTSLFLVAIDPDGSVVAGLRAHGPHATADEIAGFQPWLGTPGEAALRSSVEAKVPLGVAESKGGWSIRSDPRRPELGALVARGVVHVTWLLGVRYGFGVSPLHQLDSYRSSGARPDPGIPAVSYPDERYTTVPVWWDLADLSAATRTQRDLIAVERAQLLEARST
ncbi:hypothetical protein [Nocardia alba]|uniref:Uncharacterized protein n=1 Tax=Nocardia alba TaxID=225051 RepID=A0A4R1G0E5_9NOCA|nr:hypothetical protein [Nocardia alba]TCK00001.1 hypothetical protein DFR71_0987 [Nocardia alba]